MVRAVVVGMINSPDNPARLILPADWRVLGFGLALALAVTLLFGLTPAIQASTVKPAGALKGGADPHLRRRLMHGLVAAQVAFCFVVLFTSGLFLASFERLSHLPTGFSAQVFSLRHRYRAGAAALCMGTGGLTSPLPSGHRNRCTGSVASAERHTIE